MYLPHFKYICELLTFNKKVFISKMFVDGINTWISSKICDEKKFEECETVKIIFN